MSTNQQTNATTNSQQLDDWAPRLSPEPHRKRVSNQWYQYHELLGRWEDSHTMIPIPWDQVMPPWYQNPWVFFQSGMTWHDFREIDMLLRCQGKLSTSVTSADVFPIYLPQKIAVCFSLDLPFTSILPSNHFSFASKCFKVVSSFRQNFSSFFLHSFPSHLNLFLNLQFLFPNFFSRKSR